MAYSTYATILHTVLQAFILTHEANLSKLDEKPAQTFNKVLEWSDRIHGCIQGLVGWYTNYTRQWLGLNQTQDVYPSPPPGQTVLL